MAGIRIQHPTQRNVRFTITDPSVPYSTPRECTPPEYGGCGRVHTHKTHHLNLDEMGACIIGDVLYEKIKGYLVAFGFSETNVVKKPPAMGIGLGPRIAGSGAWGNIPVIVAGEGD
jgi:hypothetical protein